MANRSSTRWTIVDLFSGCGGMSCGFHSLSEHFELVEAVDKQVAKPGLGRSKGTTTDCNLTYKVRTDEQPISVAKADKARTTLGKNPANPPTAVRATRWLAELDLSEIIRFPTAKGWSLKYLVPSPKNVHDKPCWNEPLCENCRSKVSRHPFTIRGPLCGATPSPAPRVPARAQASRPPLYGPCGLWALTPCARAPGFCPQATGRRTGVARLRTKNKHRNGLALDRSSAGYANGVLISGNDW